MLRIFETLSIFIIINGKKIRPVIIKIKLKQNLYLTNILLKLIEKERSGDYLGKTVQMIPHSTNIIKEFISYVF